MGKEAIQNLQVGDRLSDGARVTDVRYVKQGAIGFEIDDPETLARIDKALAEYAAEARRRQFGPWTEEELQEMEEKEKRERRFMHLPLDSSI